MIQPTKPPIQNINYSTSVQLALLKWQQINSQIGLFSKTTMLLLSLF